MNTGTLQPQGRRTQKGFTLLEISTAMALMMVLAITLVAMMQQHVLFMQMCQRQSFLTSEAPKIGNIVGRILNSSDSYFVYATKADALGAGAPVLGTGSAVKLFFKSAAQVTQTRVIAVEPSASGASLRFYAPLANGTTTSWTITSKLASASFLSAEGILSITLNGPNGEQITYSGGAR